ncbi:ATP-dependent DNA helicase RRM3 [Frankliniella fusca]|uniref:ATP-dependent DNA helicase n=2 Tax=Frankliniella fusca TaxID=407009 RepID=A0AAE1HJG0_9NEOP|nr:ATP-dependent DNA helicase RRM3 [Frankliniella fusca]
MQVVPGSVSTTSSTPAYSTAFDGAFDVPLTTSTSTFSPHRSPIRFEDCIPWMSPITTPCKRRYSYRKNRLLNTSSEDDDSVASPPISPVHHLQKRLYSQVLAGTASLSLTPPLHQRAGTILDVDLVAIDRQSQPGLDVSSSGSQADNKRTTKRLSKAEKKKLANQRKAKTMQLKRENEAAKLAERERNADAKRRKRETESFRQSEAERDAVARRRARLDKLRRQQEAERDREAKRIGRLDAERRQQEAERDREAKRIGRLDAERRQQETDRDREAKRIARLDAERRQQETDRDREAKRIARLDAERRQQEADRDRDAKRIGRLDAERRQQETDRDREAKRIARLDAERRQQGAERSREAMRFARLDEERRQQEAERDREAKRIARLDEERRQQEAKRDREAKRITRGNVHNREQEAARDCTARQLRRQDPAARQHEHVLRSVRGAERNTFPVMEAEFRKKCKEGPTHICCCCGQLWFKASITIWSEEQIAEKVHVDGWSDACGVQRSSGDPYTLCGTCKKYFTQEKRIPPLALINGLRFPDVPPALQGLRPLEERLVSPRIPFMQIRELGVCRQYGIRGSCVNVPVDINRAVSALPRHLGNVQTVFVKLVRRMRDTHAYASDHVRLPIVFEAGRYLINTPLFIQYGVTLDENWLEQVQIELDQLQQDLDREDDGGNPDDPGEHEDDAGWEDVNEEDEMLADQETLLDDVDIISPDTGISIAPGENRMPTSLLFDKHVEELSFPTIYCGLARNVASSVSVTQIAKAEARMFDRRCAANIPKLFLSFCRLRRQKIAAQVTLALRKKRYRTHVTVRDMLNAETVEQLIQHNDGYKILQVDRSSPAYWERRKKTVFAMFRQFGLPTLFITFSCAETRLVELLMILSKVATGVNITEDEARAIAWQDKVRLVQADPITVTRYLHRRFKEMWKVLGSRGGPFKDYKMWHHFFRVEMQHRGSMHFHCILWLEGAPLFNPANPESEEECAGFIDESITCMLDQDMGELLNVQFHRHSRTCRRQVGGRRVCRFGVPFSPMRRTRILLPFEESVPDDVRKQLSAEYHSLQQRILALHKETPDISFDEFLEAIGMEEEHYIAVVRSQVRQPKVFLRRDLKDIKLNSYNKLALPLNEGNMDIQFMPDPYGAAVYMVNYTGKSDRGISKLIKETADKVRAGHTPLKEQLRAISNVFINKSEVSAQEASLHILGLSMAEASVADIYINTSPPEERVRLQKAAAELRRIFEEDPGSTDIFAAGLLEHYVQRPDDLEQCCLAEFAAMFTFHSKPRSKRANAAAAQDVCVEEENEDDVEVNEEDETRPPPPIAECLVVVAQKDLQLKDKSGYVSRRAPDKEGRDNPKVIRYRNYSPATDPDNFMREQLMLFSHWRDENTLVSNTRGLYEANLDVVKANRAKYVKLDINMEEVLEEVMRREERDEEGDNELDNAVPEDFRVFEADNDHNADIGLDVAPDILNVNAPLSERFLLPHHIPENDYLALVACLNERQRRYHLNIVHILKTRPDEQVLHFVTGGAGVGKSALIKAITQSAIRIFVKMFQENPNHLTVAIMAPTGKVAFGVGGVTIASALKIFTENPTMTLGPDELNTLRTQLAHVRLIIIDEVSMVGREMCAQIDKRLKQIFNSPEPFGGN